MPSPYFRRVTPRLTIITVTLNAEKYIGETMESVLAQSFTDYEHLVFDGVSKDKTLEIAAAFPQDRVTIVSRKDKGIYDAMNQAIAEAKGEWLYFLNAGDTLHGTDILAKIFNNETNCEADLLSGFVKTKNDPTGVSLLSGKPLSLQSFYHQIPVSHQGAFIKRKLFAELGNYDTFYTVVADQQWFVRFFKAGSYKYIFTGEIFADYETVGYSFNNRLKGLRQMLHYSKKYFPLNVTLINYLRYPVMVLKSKTIKALQFSKLYTNYRQMRYKK